MTTFQDRMDEAIKIAGSQSDLARLVNEKYGLNIKPQTIQYLADRNKDKLATGSKITPQIADVTGLSAKWLATGDGEKFDLSYSQKKSTSGAPIEESTASEYVPITKTGRIPVVGIVRGGADGYISIDDHPVGEGNGHIRLHTKDNDAYAVSVRGNSMYPRMRSGDWVVVEPNIEAQPGDDVVVKMKDGRCMVKTLLNIRDGEISLGSINDGVAPLPVFTEEVEKIHRVGAIIPRGSALFSKG